MGEPAVVGWREWVGFPDLGIERIKAKVDTGARSSAIHAYGLKRFTRRGERWIRFRVHPIQKDERTDVVCEGRLLETRTVKSSTGNVTVRPVVLTTLEWRGEKWEIELTLVRRDEMGFRLLVGRQAMKGRWMVDPARSFVGGRRRKTKSKTTSGSQGSGKKGDEEQ